MGLPAHHQEGQPLPYLFHMKKEILLCLATQPCLIFCNPAWTVACQAPLSIGILQARTLEWVAMPSPGDLPNPGIEPRSLSLQADSLPSEQPGKPTPPTPQKCLVASKKFKPHNCRAELGVLWPMGHILSKAKVCFSKESFIRTQPHPIGYVFPVAAPTLNGRVE